MAISDFFRRSSPLDRLLEEQLYAAVVSDLRNGVRRDGLWAKALVEARGCESDAKHRYIRLCVQALRDEMELAKALSEAEVKEPRAQPPANKPAEVKASPGPPPAKKPQVPEIDRYDESGRTALMNAARSGDLSKILELLARGADPHITDDTFGTSTALDIAMRESRAAPGKAPWAEIIAALTGR